jgi:hypothetical protein
MKQTKANQKPSAENISQPDFHGASIVTDSGTEIPITEQMLQKTFKALIDAWEKSRQN